MRRTFLMLIGLCLLALALAACAEEETGGGLETRGGGGGGPLPICQPEGLQTPVLFTPEDGALVEVPGLSFSWVYNPAGCLPQQYEMDIARSPDFEGSPGAVFDGDTTSWSPATGPDPATVYYWRMRALVQEGAGPWSPTWSFYTGPVCEAASLAAPEPVRPLGFMFVYDAPSFEWTYPDDACVPEGYHLQVASDSEFTTLIVDQRETNPETIWTPLADFENCGIFYWRVAAIRGDSDGPYSSAQTFSVNAGATCTQPCTEDQLVEPMPVYPPPYGNVGTAPLEGPVPGLLEWHHPMPCFPDRYVVHLSTEQDFSDTSLFGEVSPVTAFGGNWGPNVALERATQYWWEVYAVVGTTVGPTSPVRSFFTGPECPSALEIVPPTLLSPEDGAVVDTLAPWLRYAPGPGGCVPDGYSIYLDTDDDFVGEDPYASINFPGTTFIPDPLEDCTTYYWRVQPIQGPSVPPSSDTWSFRTQAGGGCLADLLHGLAVQEAGCLHGPGPGWPTDGYVVVGDRVPVYGTDMARRWLAIDNPDNPGQRCWVPSEAIEPEGWEIGRLRILNPPLACSRDLSQENCIEAGGSWIQPAPSAGPAPAPYCQCP